MGKNNGFFSEEDILKLKEAEKVGGGDKPRGGCGPVLIVIGFALIAFGLFWVRAAQGDNAGPSWAQTAVAEKPSATPPGTAQPTATKWPTSTLVPTRTPHPTNTATAVPTHTPLPTQTPYPTYTPYPSATWTAQPTLTPQATFTPQPTHTATPTASATAQPTVAPVPTERPFLAPIAIEANPPNDSSSPPWLPWLIGGLITLALTALGVLAYVSRQMRPPTAPAPAAAMPPGGGGQTLPPPNWAPVREPRPAPVPAPVTPVSPLGDLPEVAPVQNAAPPEKIELSVTDANASTDEATMKAICAAWNEIKARGERPSLNKVCQEYFGGKNSERMAIARRALKWGRAHGHIQAQQTQAKSEVTHDSENHPKPKTENANRRRPRRPIPIINRHGRSNLN